MSSPNIQHLSLYTPTDSDAASEVSTDDAVSDDLEGNTSFGTAIAAIDEYLEANSPAYLKLQQLRLEGWESAEADRFFAEQEREAEEDSAEASARLHRQMKRIATDMQSDTKAFTIKAQAEPKHILDLSVAPGALLAFAIKRNPTAQALAFNPPTEECGLVLVEKETGAVKIHRFDITMFAADIGVGPDEIPQSHPDADEFVHSRYLEDDDIFDLFICDSTIQPIHKTHREFRRLLLTQLVMGLEHLREGGTMIVLLHKVERLQTFRLLLDFKRFAKVTLFKHVLWPGNLSSFYMIASRVRSASPKAREAVQEWKREWKVATLGSHEEWRDERASLAGFGDLGIEGVLEEFGPTLVKLGRKIWETQADAMKLTPFMRK
ncbi:hypothetical protein F5883DRAFT_671090 [Diaporthe sp. PMI_573]|nr:hypothetical protein F5883DRAFT_671090 [Diaporthaceae sp. PMI_573]